MLMGYALQPPSVSPLPLRFYYPLSFRASLLMRVQALLVFRGFCRRCGDAVRLMEQLSLCGSLWRGEQVVG